MTDLVAESWPVLTFSSLEICRLQIGRTLNVISNVRVVRLVRGLVRCNFDPLVDLSRAKPSTLWFECCAVIDADGSPLFLAQIVDTDVAAEGTGLEPATKNDRSWTKHTLGRHFGFIDGLPSSRVLKDLHNILLRLTDGVSKS